eukprot:gene27617-7254_t
MGAWVAKCDFFARADSKFFEEVCQSSFNECDVESDGQIDTKELYIGLLKLYDQMNDLLPCHIKVPPTESIKQLMAEHDADKSGKLDFAEYLSLCKALVGTKKTWKDSITFKIFLAVGLNVVAIPLIGFGMHEGFKQIPGTDKLKGAPRAIFNYAAGYGVQQTGIVP